MQLVALLFFSITGEESGKAYAVLPVFINGGGALKIL